jgi:hypothetical protein
MGMTKENYANPNAALALLRKHGWQEQLMQLLRLLDLLYTQHLPP